MTDIAIIGMACRFPQANSLADFYQLLRNGKDCVREISGRRKYTTQIDSTKEYQACSYLEDIDKFDYNFFEIPYGEARYIDPHQRILLEVVYEAIENAGYNVDYFSKSNTALLIGDTYQQYYQLASDFNPLLVTGNINSATAGRIARFFNLHGLASMVDTACSSSLVATHLACNYLLSGEADHAIVCGINLNIFPEDKNSERQIGNMAADGKAKSFSSAADGTGSGEAAGCVLLKPLEKALADGDIIHAVIKGTAVNQDAQRSGSLSAPSSKAQTEVLIKAWTKAGIAPETITSIEAHGTGTRLGDPIEIEAINSAFSQFTNKKQFCAVSTVKTNIGHADSAAGITGLIKTVLSLKHKELFPSLHFNEPNPFINFSDSALYVNTRLGAWEVQNGDVRRAGVSSFGISGTNCHVVLEQAPEIKGPQASNRTLPYYPILMSAKTPEDLLSVVAGLKNHLSLHPEVSLADLSTTLSLGRKHYPCRQSIIGQSLPDVSQQLLDKSHMRTTSRTAGHIWLTASADARITEADLHSFSDHYSAFRRAHEECQILIEGLFVTDALIRFMFQYCFFTLLNSFGFTSKRIIGSGIGKILIDVLNRKLTLKGAVKKISTEDYDNQTTDKNRLMDFAKTRLVDGQSAVVELGPEGEITKMLRELGPSTTYTVFSLGEKANSLEFLKLLTALFDAGADIDWKPLYEDSLHLRQELPTYPFKKTRCWLDRNIQDRSIYNWFYRLAWESSKSEEPILPIGKIYLIVMDQLGLGEEVCRMLTNEGNHCIKLGFGNTFFEQQADTFTIDCADPQHYTRLLQTLDSRKIKLNGVFFFNEFSGGDTVFTDDLEVGLRDGICAEFLLMKSLTRNFKSNDFCVIQVISGAHEVTKRDIVAPDKHASFGMVKALLSETTTLRVKSIDIPVEVGVSGPIAQLVIREAFAENEHPFVAYRGGVRYVQRLTRIREVDEVCDKVNFRTDGVYLITGGTSGIGLALSRLIASRVRCRLILVGRTPLPPRDRWEAIARNGNTANLESIKIREIKALEELGAQVTYYQAAVEDRNAVRILFEELRDEGVSLNGIFHAAGIGGERISLDQLSLKSFMDVLYPKVHGTCWLDELSAEMDLDHFVLFSSLNTTIPQAHTLDYTVANAFEDAYAARVSSTKGRNICAINWGQWGETGAGERVDVRSKENLAAPLRAWNTEDGLMALELAVNLKESNVIVGDMDTKFLQFPFFKFEEIESPSIDASVTYIHTSEKRHEQLLDIWRAILGRSDVGLNDNFFKLGGHSLLGAQLINRIDKQFGLRIAFRDLLSSPTVAMLSVHLDNVWKTNSKAYEPIAIAGTQTSYALSDAQRRVWIANQANKNQSAYNLYSAFRFIGDLNRTAFEKAFTELIRRHESLRTNFILERGEPRQKINDTTVNSFALSYLDLSEDSEAEQKIQELALQEASTVFNLEVDQLIRGKLICVAETEFVFLFTLHHIVSDGWSIGIIIKEILTLYQAFDQGHSYPLAPLRIQYKDYAVWQAKQLLQPQSEEHRKYWTETLQSHGGVSPLDLPLDRMRPAKPTFKGGVVNILIDQSVIKKIKHLSERHDATVFISLVTAFKILFHKYSGQTDIAIGSMIAGRNHPDLEDQIGFFLNILVLRTRFSEQDTVDDVLEKIKETTLSAYEHQSYPFEKLAEELAIVRELGRQPLFDVVINMLNFKSTKFTSLDERLRISPYPLDTKESKFDLTIYISEVNDDLQIALEYNADIFNHRTIELMAKRFTIILHSLVEHPAEKISNLVWKETMRLPSIVAVER